MKGELHLLAFLLFHPVEYVIIELARIDFEKKSLQNIVWIMESYINPTFFLGRALVDFMYNKTLSSKVKKNKDVFKD